MSYGSSQLVDGRPDRQVAFGLVMFQRCWVLSITVSCFYVRTLSFERQESVRCWPWTFPSCRMKIVLSACGCGHVHCATLGLSEERREDCTDGPAGSRSTNMPARVVSCITWYAQASGRVHEQVVSSQWKVLQCETRRVSTLWRTLVCALFSVL